MNLLYDEEKGGVLTMNYKINKSMGIKWSIVGLAVVIFLMIWPMNIIQDTYVSKSDEVVVEESDPISVENNATQMFVSEGDYLESVQLYICNQMQSQIVTFRVYDSAYSQIDEIFYTVDKNAKLPGFVTIPIELEMEEGWSYYYTMEGLTEYLYVNYEDTFASSSMVNGTLTRGGIEIPERNIIIRYNYTSPFPWWKTLICGALLALLAWAATLLVDKLFKNKLQDKIITTQTVIQWIANPVIAVVTGIMLFSIFPGKQFGTGWINYGFYYLGTLILASMCLYIVNFKREGTEPLFTKKICKIKFPHILQSICFAGCLWSCYEYMNGLYDIFHTYATCRLLIWFGLAIITTYTKKELLNWYNLVYIIVAPIAGYFYAKPYEGIVEQDVLYQLQAKFFIIAGFVLMNTIGIVVRLIIQAVKKKEEKLGTKINIPYFIAVVVMVGALVLFRNTREWPILIAAMFAVFYFRLWVWKDRKYLLQNFCNGIAFNFVYAIGYCLMYRPYHRYFYYRYPMMFHTVTVTGTYLTLVICALLVKWIVKYHKVQNIKETWFETILLGIATTYLLFTLSRTGFAATLGAVIVVLVVAVVSYKKGVSDRLKVAGKTIGVWLVATIICFPMVFTLVRIVPTVVDEPVSSEVELLGASITKGYPSDGEYYIDIMRFFEVAGIKVIHLNEISMVETDVLLASTELTDEAVEATTVIEEEEETADITNGRLDIFATYLSNMNSTGHDDMWVFDEAGEMLVHAHNIYIQVMYDHGIPVGILFLVFGIYTFVMSVKHFAKNKEVDGYALLTVAVFVGFAVAGLAEWIFHPCNPFGFSIFVVIAPLLWKESRESL